MKGVTPLRLRLLETGVTQKELSERSNIHPTTVSMICSGRLNPDGNQRSLIAKALRVKEIELFEAA
ncbi:MAG: helix-turn-helix domain-containing protein [Deltaproteobacteria bacterium]|nr:helix-turn-helix domain-containing protein [Deltaproteobacteria bacterium]